MLEDGQIDRDTALIQYTPPDFTTKFWQLISDDIERDLLKRNRAVMHVSPNEESTGTQTSKMTANHAGELNQENPVEMNQNHLSE